MKGGEILKKKILILSFIAAAGISTFSIYSTLGIKNVLASQFSDVNSNKDLSNPKMVAENYFDAYLANDFDKMIKYSVDLNYLDDNSRRLGYEEFAPVNLEKYDILSYKTVSDNQINIKVKYKFSEVNDYPVLPFSIIKYEEGWKMLITPLEVNMATGAIKEGTPIYKMNFMD